MNVVAHKFQWKLKNFNKESVAKYEGKTITSEIFEASLEQNKMQWRFFIRIDQDMGVFLQKVQRYSYDDTVIFKAYVIDNNGAEEYNIHFETTIFWTSQSKGLGGFLTNCDVLFNEPKKYLENDALTIGCEIYFIRHQDIFEPYDGSKDVKKALEELHKQYFNSGIYSDFTITCSDGVDIPAHKMILAAHSDVFQKMFDTPMIESRDQKVVIEDIDSETMLEILRFMYLREVENLDELVARIYYGAHKYEIEELKHLCVTSMIEDVSVENAVEYFVLADKYNENHLLQECLEFIKTNYQELRSRDVIKDVESVRLMQIITDHLSKPLQHPKFLITTL